MSSSSQNQDQSTSSVQDKKEPTDYDILAYEQSIKEKEASQQPLVSSDRESIEVLLGEYAQNPAFLEKLKVLLVNILLMLSFYDLYLYSLFRNMDISSFEGVVATATVFTEPSRTRLWNHWPLKLRATPIF